MNLLAARSRFPSPLRSRAYPLSPAALISTAGLAAAAIVSAPAARADALTWINAAGGPAATAANWSPAQVPDPTDTLTFNLNSTFTVTFSATTATVTSHTYKRGTVTLAVSSPHAATSFIRVGDVSGDSATVRVTSGTLRAGTALVVGNNAGSTGALAVDNEATLVETTGAGSDIVVGSAGTGTLTITDGALVRPADDLVIGSAAAGVGTVSVTGTGALPLPIPSSTLDLPNAGQDLTVGALGEGELNISTGALVSADEVFVALNPGSTGIVAVGGTGGLLNVPATLSVATSLHLGNNPSIGAGAGSAVFTVNSGGLVQVDGTTRLGDPQGVGACTLTVNSGGEFITSSLVASDTGGFLNLLGGAFRVRGGSFQPMNGRFVLDSSVDRPVFYLEQGATGTLSAPDAPFEALVVGRINNAAPQGNLFRVNTGAVLNVSSGDIIIGDLAGSQGTMQVDAEGRLNAPAGRAILIGDAGTGQLDVLTGATVNIGAAHLGAQNTGVGTVNVNSLTGTISNWNLSGVLAIGGTPALARGQGTVTIGNAGVVRVTNGTGTSVRVWSAGDALTIETGGQLVASGTVLISDTASFTLAGGVVDARSLTLDSNTELDLTGTVAGGLTVPGTNTTARLVGPLTITDGTAAPAGLINAGTILVGNHTFTIGGTPTMPLDLNTCTLGSAGRIVSDSPARIGTADTLSGSGTVDAPITNNGFIVAQGAGLTFTKALTGVGQGISGTRITLGDGGEFIGSGAFSTGTQINAQSGSRILVTGDLTMGAAASTAGFFSNGLIEFAPPTESVALFALNDFNGAVVTSVAFPVQTPGPAQSGGVLRCTSGLGIQNGGRVTGSGSLGGDHDSAIFLSGAIDPGSSSVPGRMRLEGDVILNPSGRLEFDIFGSGPTDHDRIHLVLMTTDSGTPLPTAHASDLNLNGGTLVVRVSPDHTPVSGERHHLIELDIFTVLGLAAGRINGAFDSIILPPKWLVRVRHFMAFEPGPIGLFAVFCPADFNADSNLDPDDLGDFINCFFAVPPCGDADFNADGNVDPDDLGDFINAFFAGC